MFDAYRHLEKSPLYEWYKANEEPKDYQGRAEDGTFGSGTSGGADSKEQELQDRDAGKQAAPLAPAKQKEPPGQAVKKLYDGFQNVSFQDIQPQVEAHFGKLSPQDAKQTFKQAFGYDPRSSSRAGIIQETVNTIKDRKASFERTQFGQTPVKQTNTQLPAAVQPTISHKQTGERQEFVGINPASPKSDFKKYGIDHIEIKEHPRSSEQAPLWHVVVTTNRGRSYSTTFAGDRPSEESMAKNYYDSKTGLANPKNWSKHRVN